MSRPTGPVHVPARPRSALFLSLIVDAQTADQEKRWEALSTADKEWATKTAEAWCAKLAAGPGASP